MGCELRHEEASQLMESGSELEKVGFGEQDREFYVQKQTNQETSYKTLDNFVI